MKCKFCGRDLKGLGKYEFNGFIINPVKFVCCIDCKNKTVHSEVVKKWLDSVKEK